MMNLPKLGKGLSVLLCLGFLVFTAEVKAQDAAAAQQALKDAEFAYDSAMNSCNAGDQTSCALVDSLYEKYKTAAKAAEKVQAFDGIDVVTDAVTITGDASAYNAKRKQQFQDSLNEYGKINLNDTIKPLQPALTEQQLKNKVEANKKQAKADQKLDKANEKQDEADKLAADNAAKQQKLKDAEFAYDSAMNSCNAGDEGSCNMVEALYKAYEKAAKDAGKSAKAAEKAQKKADKASDKAVKAQLKANEAYSKNCPEGQVWDVENGGCVDPNAKLNESLAYMKAADGALKEQLQDQAEATLNGLENVQVDGSLLGSDNPAAVDLSNKQLVQEIANARPGKTAKDCQSLRETLSGETEGKNGGKTYNIFHYLACKITSIIADLRVIVYILAGFGMIMFAYGAIIGKINFKQLAYMGIGLFILSMTTSVIEYIVFSDKSSSLEYGDWLPDGNHAKVAFRRQVLDENGNPVNVNESADYEQIRLSCENDPSMCPDARLAGMKDEASKSSWSLTNLKDLKSAFKAGKDAFETTAQIVNTGKAVVNTVVKSVDGIGQAIKNGNLTGLADAVGNATTAIGAVTMMANETAQGLGRISEDMQDATSSRARLEYVEALETEYKKMSSKCASGGCSENEMNSLKNMETALEAEKTKTTKWLENEGKGGGATILKGINKIGNIADSADDTALNTRRAANTGKGVGSQIGGQGLGEILGTVYAGVEGYTKGADALQKNKEEGNFDFRSEEQKKVDNEKAAEEAAKKVEKATSAQAQETVEKVNKEPSEETKAAINKLNTECSSKGGSVQVRVVAGSNGSQKVAVCVFSAKKKADCNNSNGGSWDEANGICYLSGASIKY